jgi:hypothetical protein
LGYLEAVLETKGIGKQAEKVGEEMSTCVKGVQEEAGPEGWIRKLAKRMSRW